MKRYLSFLKSNLMVFIVFFYSPNSISEELSTIDQEALGKTEDLLKNKADREKVISASPDAKKADSMVNDLQNQGLDKEQIYSLAASIFRNIAHDAKGDGDKMLENMSHAQSNPEAFYNSLSPDQKKTIEDMVRKIQLAQPAAKP